MDLLGLKFVVGRVVWQIEPASLMTIAEQLFAAVGVVVAVAAVTVTVEAAVLRAMCPSLHRFPVGSESTLYSV